MDLGSRWIPSKLFSRVPGNEAIKLSLKSGFLNPGLNNKAEKVISASRLRYQFTETQAKHMPYVQAHIYAPDDELHKRAQ